MKANLLFLEELAHLDIGKFDPDVADYIVSLLRRTVGMVGRYVIVYENKRRAKRLSTGMEQETPGETAPARAQMVL